MRNSLIKRVLLAAIVPLVLTAAGQPASDTLTVKPNELNIDLQFMTRGETRYGGLISDDKSDDEKKETSTPKSQFFLTRTRLVFDFKRDWFEARVTPQHSGVWGQEGKGSFNLYETWVKLQTPFDLFVQVGRVALNYDDERIIGSDDWAMVASSHDVLRTGYEGHGHKAHLILAYNQNASVQTTGKSVYKDGDKPYKTMQTIWYHYDLPRFPLGASVLFMNIGMQGITAAVEEKPRTYYQQLLGGHVKCNPPKWNAEASYYRQFGKSEESLKIDAWMASGKVSFSPANYGFTVGYDYLSGDDKFAVPRGGDIGVIQHKVIKGFNTVYGSHHKFYGAMDFFYVSTYLNGFTPGLQNAYIGGYYKPLKNLKIDLSYHYLATATKLEGLEKSLGNEVELQVSYYIKRDINLSCGGSIMKGGDTMNRLKRSTNKNSLRWGWIKLTVNPTIFSIKW